VKITPFQRGLVFGLAILVLMNSVGIFALTYVGAGLHRAFESEEKNTAQLVMSESEYASLAWVGHHDFIFNNTVYDFDGVVKSNGNVIVNCHSDNEETSLKNSLADNFDSGSKNPLGAKPVKELFKVFPVFPFETAFQMPSVQTNGTLLFSSNTTQPLQSADIRLNSPPPELA